jgi:hypothetical protein
MDITEFRQACEQQRERGREREITAHTNTQQKKSKHAHAAQHAHAQKITRRSGEPSAAEKGGLGVSPRTGRA